MHLSLSASRFAQSAVRRSGRRHSGSVASSAVASNATPKQPSQPIVSVGSFLSGGATLLIGTAFYKSKQGTPDDLLRKEAIDALQSDKDVLRYLGLPVTYKEFQKNVVDDNVIHAEFQAAGSKETIDVKFTGHRSDKSNNDSTSNALTAAVGLSSQPKWALQDLKIEFRDPEMKTHVVPLTGTKDDSKDSLIANTPSEPLADDNALAKMLGTAAAGLVVGFTLATAGHFYLKRRSAAVSTSRKVVAASLNAERIPVIIKLVTSRIQNNNRAKKLLGSPIKTFRNPETTNSVNSLQVAKFNIFCKGPKGEGTLKINAGREVDADPWMFTRLDLYSAGSKVSLLTKSDHEWRSNNWSKLLKNIKSNNSTQKPKRRSKK